MLGVQVCGLAAGAAGAAGFGAAASVGAGGFGAVTGAAGCACTAIDGDVTAAAGFTAAADGVVVATVGCTTCDGAPIAAAGFTTVTGAVDATVGFVTVGVAVATAGAATVGFTAVVTVAAGAVTAAADCGLPLPSGIIIFLSFAPAPPGSDAVGAPVVAAAAGVFVAKAARIGASFASAPGWIVLSVARSLWNCINSSDVKPLLGSAAITAIFDSLAAAASSYVVNFLPPGMWLSSDSMSLAWLVEIWTGWAGPPVFRSPPRAISRTGGVM